MKLTLAVARMLGEIAEEKALETGVPMTIAVSDANGGLLYFMHMDHALPASSDIAITKAYTAAAFRMPTAELGELAKPGQPLFGITESQKTPVALFGGGLPLKGGGAVMGAIGISGGTVDEDILVADRVGHIFGQMWRWGQAMGEVLAAHVILAETARQAADGILQALKEREKALSGDEVFILKGSIHMVLDKN